MSSTRRHFSEVSEELNLCDLPLVRGTHIHGVAGVNNQLSPRFDRFLVLKAWENHFSNLSQSYSRRGEKRGNPFRFENMWLKVEGFKE